MTYVVFFEDPEWYEPQSEGGTRPGLFGPFESEAEAKAVVEFATKAHPDGCYVGLFPLRMPDEGFDPDGTFVVNRSIILKPPAYIGPFRDDTTARAWARMHGIKYAHCVDEIDSARTKRIQQTIAAGSDNPSLAFEAINAS